MSVNPIHIPSAPQRYSRCNFSEGAPRKPTPPHAPPKRRNIESNTLNLDTLTKEQIHSYAQQFNCTDEEAIDHIHALLDGYKEHLKGIKI